MINYLRLKNFGQFTELQFELPGSIFGLLGPNGSGKSTILHAIRFALTGYLSDNAETYITDMDETKKAEVELGFTKLGKRCVIERIIGKRSTRSLTIEGEPEPVTSAEAVESLMTSMWGGSSKTAMLYGVFINQGELDKLLFGKNAEREQLFVRLMGLNHCVGVCGIIDQVIAQTKIGIVDNSAVIDEVKASYAELNGQVFAQQTDLSGRPDLTQVRRIASAMAAHRASVESTESLKVSTRAQIAQINADLASYRTQTGQPDAAAIVEIGKALRAEVESATTKAATLRGNLANISLAREAASRFRIASENLAATPPASTSKIDELQSASASLEETCKKLNELGILHGTVSVNLERERKLRQELLEAEEALRNLAEPDATRLPELTSQVQLLNLTITLLSARLASHLHVERCPACGSDTPDQEFCTPENLAKCRADLQTAAAAIQEINTAKSQYVDRLSLLKRNVDTLTASLAAASNRSREDMITWKANCAVMVTSSDELIPLEKIQERWSLISADLAQTQNELSALKATRDTFASIQREFDQASAKLDAVKTSTGLDPDKLSDIEVQQMQAEVDKLNAVVQEKSQHIDGWLVWHKSFTDIQSRLASNQMQLQQLENTEHSTEEAKITGAIHAEPLGPHYLLNGSSWVNVDDDLMGIIDQVIGERTSVAAQLAQASVARDNAVRRIQELEAQQKATEKRQDAVKKLTELRLAMDRKGIPMLYVRYRFAQIAALTQMFLQDMGSNYSVEPDPEESVSFRFFRSDKSAEGGSILPQSKLSGGQRVRLGVAFLLAVQRLINPDTGLLVLDEPSMHLDDQAKEALRDLLESMSERMRNANTQILIADHDDTIKTAFTGSLVLKA